MYKEYTFNSFNIILSYFDNVPYFNIELNGYSYTKVGIKNNYKWYEQLVQIFDNPDSLLRNIEYHSTYLIVIFSDQVYSNPEFIFKERFNIDKEDFPMYLMLKSRGNLSTELTTLKSDLVESQEKISVLENKILNLVNIVDSLVDKVKN